MITIVGPTASGKTRLATAVARALHGEIISADSRQVYREMTLGTGKDLADYEVRDAEGHLLATLPYHLIDIREPGYRYSLYEYQRDFHKVYADLCARHVTPILCGGTGLYVEGVLKGYEMHEVPTNPALRASLQDKSLEQLTEILRSYKTLHNQTDTDTRARAIREIEIRHYYQQHAASLTAYPAIESLLIGTSVDRDTRRARITRRLHERLDAGMVDEVRHLLNDRHLSPDDLLYYGLEYKYITLYLTEQCTYQEMVDRLEIAIHQFAKRQMTWFRGMERRGLLIHWIPADLSDDEKTASVLSLWERWQAQHCPTEGTTSLPVLL